MMWRQERWAGWAGTWAAVAVMTGMGVGMLHAAETEEGLVARFRFDEGSGDVVKNSVPGGKDGKIYGAKYVKRGKGHALLFDGTDDYVRAMAGPRSAFDVTGKDLSVECWFRVDDPKATWRGLCGNYHSGAGGYMLVYSSNAVNFYQGAPPGGPSGGVNVKEKKWHHAVGVLENGTMILYLNGVKQTRILEGKEIKTSNQHFDVGRFSAANYFKGAIDEVSLYKRALSAEEVKARYEKGKIADD